MRLQNGCYSLVLIVGIMIIAWVPTAYSASLNIVVLTSAQNEQKNVGKSFAGITTKPIRNIERASKLALIESSDIFKLFKFTNNISKYFSKTELAITRSGSSITAELINCRIPFISIPYPYAADSHQEKNAIYFKEKGYSLLVKENEVNEKLFPLIKLLYKDKKLLGKMIEKQKNHSDKKTFFKINQLIENLKNE